MAPSNERPDEGGDDGLEWDDDRFMSALVLTPRPPFIAWAREVVPDEPDPPELTVVLAPQFLRDEDRSRWLEQHYDEVFAAQLGPWTEDEAAWPEDRTLQMFLQWFEIAWTPSVDDCRDLPLRPPVSCGPVSLAALRDEFASLVEGSELYLDVQSGDMVSFSPTELDALDRDDPGAAGVTADALADMRLLYATDTLVPLPSPSASVSLQIMNGFAEDVRVPAVRNRLLNALESKKPARRFLEAIDASGLRKQWATYSKQAVVEAMKVTLDSYRVPYLGATESDEPVPQGRRSVPSPTR